MTSVLSEALEPSRKRQKLSSSSPHSPSTSEPDLVDNDEMMRHPQQATGLWRSSEFNYDNEAEKEVERGIQCFVTESNTGFAGILKQRYTDFLVNEITPAGKVVHLTNIDAPRSKHFKEATEDLVSSRKTKKGDTAEPSDASSIVPSSAIGASPVSSADAGPSSIKESQPATFTLSPENAATLDSHFGAEFRDAIVKMYQKMLGKPDAKPFIFGSLVSAPIPDKAERTQIHRDLRRIFEARFESSVDQDLGIQIRAAKRQQSNFNNQTRYSAQPESQPRGKLGWSQLGGEYLHFSLYKENRDTGEALHYIASRLNMPVRKFASAGTKDRRAVTVQRISVHRMQADKLANLNKILRSSAIGDFTYEKYGLELGELSGNQFTITLRDCSCEGSQGLPLKEKMELMNRIVERALKSIQANGFLNYYGLQRFGTGKISTDIIGLKILKGDFEGAVSAVLYCSPEATALVQGNTAEADQKGLPKDDVARARAIHIWKTTGNSNMALAELPKKFTGESAIIRHLGRRGSTRDFTGAMLMVSRNLRLMYVHAYQSLVWNMVASERWRRFGTKVVAGDLVIVDTKAIKDAKSGPKEETDESGEIIVRPAADDAAITHDDLFERALPLTAEEAASGKYSIFDVVLPTPGYDINYPSNEIGDYYKEFMDSERGGKVDPANMRRSNRDFSLSGSYRKLFGEIGKDFSYDIKSYTDELQQMVQTDMDIIKQGRRSARQPVNTHSRGGDHLQSASNADTKATKSIKPAPKANPFGPSSKSFLDPTQLNPWKGAWLSIADSDKLIEENNRKRLLEMEASGQKIPPPSYSSVFIETDRVTGKRTGNRQVRAADPTDDEAGKSANDAEPASDAESANRVEPAKDAELAIDAELAMELEPGTRASSVDASTQTDVVSTTNVTTQTETIMDSRADDSSLSTGMAKDAPTASIEALDNSTLTNDNVAPATSTNTTDEDTKIAVVVKFQLSSAQYATMALRELMKGGVKAYIPEFSSK